MNTDADVSLESDKLERLLEDPSPAPPVVVVQERRRGIPSWLLFPLLFVIPACALLVYHRLVVMPKELEVLETRQALENLLVKGASASAPTSGAPVSEAGGNGAPAAGGNDKERAVVDPPASASLPPALALNASQPAVTGSDPSATKSSAPAAVPAAADEAIGGTASVSPPDASVARTDAAKAAEPAKSSNPDPNASKPSSRPALATGFDDDREFRLDNPNAPKTGFKEPGSPAPAAGNAEPVARKRDVPPAERPLPTKEETEREIQAEAEKKAEDFAAKLERRGDGLRARFTEDCVRFREELRDVLKNDRNKAGPEIDKIARRYSSECNPLLFAKAQDIWSSRATLDRKMKLVRALGVPESVILDFISAEMHKMIGSRKGPRTTAEVRVRAAIKLLSIDLPEETPAAQPDGGAVPGARPQ
jgi:hypothetical protein